MKDLKIEELFCLALVGELRNDLQLRFVHIKTTLLDYMVNNPEDDPVIVIKVLSGIKDFNIDESIIEKLICRIKKLGNLKKEYANCLDTNMTDADFYELLKDSGYTFQDIEELYGIEERNHAIKEMFNHGLL